MAFTVKSTTLLELVENLHFVRPDDFQDLATACAARQDIAQYVFEEAVEIAYINAEHEKRRPFDGRATTVEYAKNLFTKARRDLRKQQKSK
jgi:hypothetical protein